MLKEQYIKQIIRLQRGFGEAKFPEEMVKTMWWRLKGFQEQVFIYAVDNLICESKFAPRLSEILQACNQAKALQPRPLEISARSCDICRGQGVIIGDKDNNAQGWAFKCPVCDPPGLKALDTWTPEMEQIYTRRMVG